MAAEGFISVGSLTEDDLDLARKAGFDLSGYLPEDAVTREGWREVTPDDSKVGLSDVGRALGAGAAGVASGLGAAGEYLTGGNYGGDTRRFFDEIAKEQVEGMSPVARRAFQAEFLPEPGGPSVLDNWTASLGLKTVATLPSVVSSIIPAGLAVRAASGLSLATRATVGGATARGAAGLQTGGEIASQIYSSIEKLDDAELQSKSPVYAGYRSMMEEADARRMYMRDVAGAAPVVGFVLSAASGGIEGQIGRRLGGEAAKGFGRGAARGALAEGAQESLESGGGELLAQLQLADADLAQMNWRKILSQTIEGGVLGAAIGAPLGGVSGLGGGSAVKPAPVLGADVDQQAALTNEVTDQSSPSSPQGEPATTPERLDTLMMQQEKVISGEVPAMYFPVGTDELALPEGLQRVERPEGGVVHYDPAAMREQQALTAPLNTLLGYVQPKADVLQRAAQGDPATVIAEQTPDGREVRAAAVNKSRARQQAGLFEETATPGNVVTETTPESIQRGRYQVTPGEARTARAPLPSGVQGPRNRGLELLNQQSEETLQGYRDLRDSTPIYPDVTPGEARSVRGDRPVRMTTEPSKQERAAYDEAYDDYLAEQRLARQREQEARQAEEDIARAARRREGLTKAEQAIATARARAEAARKEKPKTKAQQAKEEAAARKAAREEAKKAKEEAAAAAKAEREAARKAKAEEKAKKPARAKKPAKDVAPAPATEVVPEPPRKLNKFLVQRARTLAEKDAEVRERGVGTGKRNPEEKARTAQMRADARKAFDDNPPGEGEVYTGKAQADLFRRTEQEPSQFVQTKEQAAALKARLTRIVEAAEKARPLPQSIREGQTDFVLFARMAKDAITYYVGKTDPASLEKTNAWVADEIAARAGDFEPMRKRRLEEGYAAKQRQASADEMIETAGSGDTGRRIVAATTVADVQTQIEEADENFRREMALEEIRRQLEATGEITDLAAIEKIMGRQAADMDTIRSILFNESNMREGPMSEFEAELRRAVAEAVDAYARKSREASDRGEFLSDAEVRDGGNLRLAETLAEQRLAQFERNVEAVSDFDRVYTVRQQERTGGSIVYREQKMLQRREGKPAEVVVSFTLAEAMRRDNNPIINEGGPLARQIADLIADLAGDVPLHVLRNEDYKRLFPNSNGVYTGRMIFMPESVMDSPGRFRHVMMHEGIHAALVRRVKRDTVAITQIKAIAKAVLKAHPTIGDMYAFADAQEFLAEALSNVQFQKLLAQTRLTPALAAQLGVGPNWRNKSMWWATLSKFADWLGIVRNEKTVDALEGIIALTDRLAEGRSFDYPKGWSRTLGVPGVASDAVPLSEERKQRRSSAAPRESADTAIQFDEVTNRVSDRTGAFQSWLSRVAVVGSTLDQLRQQFAGLFVGKDGRDLLTRIVENMQRMAPYANVEKEAADKLAQEFIDYSRANAAEAAKMVDIMIDATMSNVQLGEGANNKHLNTSWRGLQGIKNLPRLQREFNSLSPEAQALYQKMASFYRATQNKMTRGVINNILDELKITMADRDAFVDRVMNGAMTPADEKLFADKPTALKAFKDATGMRVIQGDYFPLMRQGDYVIVTSDKIPDLMGGKEISPGKVEFRGRTRAEAMRRANNFISGTTLKVIDRSTRTDEASDVNDFGVVVTVQRNGVFFFESEAEALKWKRENEGEFDEISGVMPRRDTGLESKDLTVAQFNALMGSINRQPGADDATKDVMRNIIEQAAARMMSGNRVQQRRIARRNVEGASKDFGRNLLLYGQSTSGYLAKLRFMPAIRADLKEMGEISKDYMDKHAAARVRVLNELTKRIDDNEVGKGDPPRWMRDIMTVTYLSKLFSPMYSVVNGMQPWMVTLPYLGGRYGSVRAASELSKAYGSVGLGGRVMEGLLNTYRAGRKFNAAAFDSTDVVGSIKKNLAKEDDGKELIALIDNLLERGAMSMGGFELSQSIAEGRGAAGSMLAHVDRVARQLPQSIEDINRAVTAIAAYRLARQANKSADKAMTEALTSVMNTQGDYSGVNAPRFFNNPVLRPALQFKKYAQMMTYLLVDATYRSFSGEMSPEERRVARRQLVNIFGVQIAMAGMLSLPGIEIAKMAFMIAALFGAGNGWDDQEEKLRKMADETFGKTWGELLSSGVLSRALNIDLSKRLSLADMWTFGEPKKYDKDGAQSYLFNLAFGAPGGTTIDILMGAKDVASGEWGTGLAKMIPIKMIADGMRAANGYSEGKVTNAELVANTLGVRTGRQAEKSREIGANIRRQQDIEKSYKDLSRQYLRAKTAGERAVLRARIVEHNKEAPLRYRVFPNALDRRRAQIEEERVN